MPESIRSCPSPARVGDRRRKPPATHAVPRLLLLLPALPLALGGCSQDDGLGDEAHLDGLPRLVLEEEARIGDVDDPDEGFSRIAGVDVDAAGGLYVLELSVPEIRVYSPEGEVLRRIGRSGDGPGEFRMVSRFGVLGDTVWAVDPGSERITLFDREGAVRSARRWETVLVPLPESYAHLIPWVMRPDGRLTSHLARISFNPENPPTGVSPHDPIPVPFVLFEGTGEVADTIGAAHRPPPRMWRPPEEAAPPRERIQVEGRQLTVPRSPTTLPWWLPAADGYVLVEAPPAPASGRASILVTRLNVRGDTVYHREIHYTPLPYTSAELDSIAARAARVEPGGGVPFVPGGQDPPDNWRAIARALRGAMDFPEFQPPIQSPLLLSDESVWLRLRTGEGEPAEWLVLDPEGRPRGRLEASPSLRPLWTDGEVLWAVEPDEYDVPWLVRFAIRVRRRRTLPYPPIQRASWKKRPLGACRPGTGCACSVYGDQDDLIAPRSLRAAEARTATPS